MAANWLKNIGGQLTEFASEVMNEAQQEVDDPESELQVEKKKSADFEKQLHAEKAKTEVLEKQVKSLEDQMYTTNMEMDAISSRFQKMIDARDNQIKTMKSELYQYQVRAEEGELSPKVTGSADLERCAQLEHHLHEDQTKLDILVAKNRTLEDQLHRLNMDLGSLNILHQNSMDARDQQIESLKGEIEALQSWGEEVDLKSTTQAEPHDAAQQKIEELHNELRDANNKNEELEETITNLRDQIRHLRLKIQTNTINQTATSEANEREMTSLRDRNAELSALLDAQQRYGQEYQHLEAQLAEKTLCNDTLAEYIRKLEEQIYKTGHPSLVDLAVYDVVDKPESSENEAQSSNEEVVNESSEGPGPNTKANLLLELQDQVVSLQKALDAKDAELAELRETKETTGTHNEIPHGTPTFEQVTERIFKEKIEKARAEVTHWKTIAGENGQAYYDEEIKKLQKALSGKELECDDQLAYILLNIETPTSHTAQADSHISNDELSEKLGRPKTTDLDNEQEIRKLRLELYELLKCFNELSTEYTRYKDQHESNPSSAMNREFTDRIDSLKASLIEYEERYEQCKRENSETVAQLEKLTADFEKLRFGVKSAGTDLAAENAQLKEKLNEALQDKEVLLNDSQKFQGTVNSIDKELERIRESNRNLHGENAELRVSLDGSRARVSESNEMLRGFRTELNEIRDAGESRVESARAVAAQLEAQRDALQAEVEGLRTKVEQNDGTIQRLRALVGDDGAHIEADHNDIDKKSDGCRSDGSNNDWERTGAEWTTDQPLSSSSGSTGVERRHSSSSDVASSFSPTTTKLDNEKLEEKLELLQAELASVAEERHILEVANSELNETVQGLEKTVDNIQTSFESINTHFNELKDTHEELVIERDVLYKKVRALTEKVQNRDEDGDATRNELHRIQGEYEKVRAELNDALAHLDHLKTASIEIETLKQAVEQKTNEIEAHQVFVQDVTNVQGDNHRLREENDKLKAERDDLLGQLNTVKTENDQSDMVKNQKEVLQAEYDKVSGQLAAVEAEVESLRGVNSEVQQMKEALESKCTEIETLLTLKNNLEAETNRLNMSFNELTAERDGLLGQLNLVKTANEAFHTQSEARSLEAGQLAQLQQALESKHNESLMYYNKIQELVQENAIIGEKMQGLEVAKTGIDRKVEEVEMKLAKSNQELALSFEEKERLLKELKRLREHLVMMEETSTKEAVAAEEREVRLRETVRMLEAKSEAATDTVVKSSNQYQHDISELTKNLEATKSELSFAEARLQEREKSLEDTTKALSNLQIVLKDLSAEHEKEIATYEEEMDDLRKDLQKAKIDLNVLKSTASEWDEEKRFIEDTVAMQKEEVRRKEKIVEELENQIEELRHASVASQSTHKIDDTVLRQLFLSYFTAAKDKQGDIAILLASILEYPDEDIATIKSSVQQSSRGWLSWMGMQEDTAERGRSLVENFVVFLENESRNEAPVGLPVESTAARLPLDEPAEEHKARKDSTEELKTILQY